MGQQNIDRNVLNATHKGILGLLNYRTKIKDYWIYVKNYLSQNNYFWPKNEGLMDYLDSLMGAPLMSVLNAVYKGTRLKKCPKCLES
jgi:hypothetical protein